MPINNITQTVSTIPAPPHRGVDVQTQFVIKQEDFQDHLQGTTVDELNTLKTQMNTMAGEMNTTASQVNTNANTTTTKANEASASATSASASASTATTQAGIATTQAGIATTQAGIATTKANEASASASTATTKANEASASATTQAGIATTKANEASASASTATTKANEASASASTATTQAGIATTKANEASASASTATTKANEASASATSASASASTATTQAGIATTFAQQAQASATSVDVNNIVHRTNNETIAGVKTFSSTISGSINGNAATTTKLATARTINGVSFDGTANIVAPTNLDITAGTTAGPIVTSSTGTNATLPTASASASGVVTTGDQTWGGVKTFSSNIVGNITGNSGTATNANNLGGKAPSYYQQALGFTPIQQGGGAGQGTNKIFIGWQGPYLRCQVDATDFGTSFPMNINGNSGTATNLATARTINGVAFDGSANITVGDPTAVKLTAFTGTNVNVGTNGYQKLPNGLITQWGTYSGTLSHGALYTATFPIAFPNACLKVIGQYGNTAVDTVTGGGLVKITQKLTNSFTFQWGWFAGGSAQVDVDYIAIGY